LLQRSQKVVFFTGAGISTESGIPDFRSPGGLWTKAAPIDFTDFVASEESRREAWRRKIILDESIGTAVPNRGHRAIADQVRRGRCSSVITQNIDGLHQLSGVPDEAVIELHGNGTFAKCLDCQKRYELTPIFDAFKQSEMLPVCDRCGGIIKTATISFGQSMPLDEMSRAQAECEHCDLMVVVGSSLVVYPAAALPLLAKESGASLVIVNRESTDLDQHADIVLNSEAGELLAYVCDTE